MRLFDCSENDEAEVTNVDKENHDVEELVLTNVQSSAMWEGSATNNVFFRPEKKKKLVAAFGWVVNLILI